MKSVNVAALAALISTGAQAVPMAGHNHAKNVHARLHHAKRDIVWETKYEIETVVVTKTVYDDGSQPTLSSVYSPPMKTPPTVTSTQYGVFPSGSSPSETGRLPSSYNTPAPAPSSSSSKTYAPAPSSSSSSTSSAVPPPPTPSSVQPAPAPAPSSSSSVAPVPVPVPEPSSYAPAPTYPAPSVTYPAPAPSPSSPSGGSPATGTFTGELTHWEPSLGACGIQSNSGQDVVAISKIVFDKYTPGTNPNANTLCGTYVTITGKDGNAYKGQIVDRCEDCASNDLDLTITLFNKATNNGDGRVDGMTWSFA